MAPLQLSWPGANVAGEPEDELGLGLAIVDDLSIPQMLSKAPPGDHIIPLLWSIVVTTLPPMLLVGGVVSSIEYT